MLHRPVLLCLLLSLNTRNSLPTKFIFSVQLLSWNSEPNTWGCFCAQLGNPPFRLDHKCWRHRRGQLETHRPTGRSSYTSLKSGAFNAQLVDCNVNLHRQAHAVRKKRGVLTSHRPSSPVSDYDIYITLAQKDLWLQIYSWGCCFFYCFCFLLIYCCFAVLSYCSCTFWSWFKHIC